MRVRRPTPPTHPGDLIQWILTVKSALMERALKNLIHKSLKAPNGSPAKSSLLVSVTVGRLHLRPERFHRMSQQ